MPRLLIGLAVVIIIITVYALVDCSLLPRERIRGLPRWAWVLVILVVPVIGPVLWLLVGRGRRSSGSRRIGRSSAPDDDPDFLKGLDRRMNDEERIRRLEQELADLDKPDAAGGAGAGGNQEVPPKKTDPGEGELPGRRDA